MVRGTVAAVAAALATTVVLGACSSGQEPQEGPTDRAVSAECRQAFAEVSTEEPQLAEPGPTAPPSPVPVDQAGAFVDLYPTVDACTSVEEWVEAFRGRNLPMTQNADPVSVLRALCKANDEDQVRSTAICQDVAVPSEAVDTKENDVERETSETPGG